MYLYRSVLPVQPFPNKICVLNTYANYGNKVKNDPNLVPLTCQAIGDIRGISVPSLKSMLLGILLLACIS